MLSTEIAVPPIPDVSEFEDLVAASTSSADFWNNPLDDEDWNQL